MKSNAEIAREIVGSWNGVLDYPPVSDTDKRDMQSAIESALTTAQSELAGKYETAMEVLREALRFSYIVGIDDPASGRICVCQGCLMETTFPYQHPFDAKEMKHYSSDCWVSRAQKILEP